MRHDAALQEQALLNQLLSLQQGLKDLQRERIQLTVLGLGGMGLLLCVVLLFILNLRAYAVDYPAETLTQAMGYEAEALLGAPELKALVGTLYTEAGANLAPALTRKMADDLPQFHREVQTLLGDMVYSLHDEISEQAVKHLLKTAQTLHADVLRDTHHWSDAEIEQATASVNLLYQQELQTLMSRHRLQATADLQGLRTSVLNLSHDSEYLALQMATVTELESNFYVALLELAAESLKPLQSH